MFGEAVVSLASPGEGEKPCVRWLGGEERRAKQMLHRLFAESEH